LIQHLNSDTLQAIVVFPASEPDVSKAVLFSTAHKLELAVRGGGHATSGSSSTDGGLCIDLSKMRSVSVDAASKTITAQGGALWSDVDTEAEKFGLAAVGGTVNHTGIGGLTLGGGYGYLTGEVGLVLDNLLEVELVLVDGSIVMASETENKDLFWAIRGAGPSFGVATKFVYRAHEQKGLVWGGMLVFPKTQLKQVITFANTVLEEGNGDKTMLVGFSAPPPAFQPAIIAVVFYNGEEENAKKFFEPLLSLGPLANITAAMPYSGVNAMLNAEMGHGFRRKCVTTPQKYFFLLTYVLISASQHERLRLPRASNPLLRREHLRRFRSLHHPCPRRRHDSRAL
jgi:FAD/FMN-containing dehydrogenase